MMPDSEDAVIACVQSALKASTPLAIEGGGTRPVTYKADNATKISLSNLRGITLYEPAEMVIGAWVGTPLAQIETTLTEHNQMLSFEPSDYRNALNTKGEPTLGGVVASNVSGPRRILAGAARDNLIGVRFVNGRGEIIKNGGRVMKNVTGLDLVKLQAGAWGTLGVLTEVIFKVTPRPPEGRTLIVEGLSDRAGVNLLGRAMGTPFEVNGAAHLPAQGDQPARTCMRLEGFTDQLGYRFPALAEKLEISGAILRDAAHDDLWANIKNINMLSHNPEHALWRISCPAMAGPDIVQHIQAQRAAEVFYDWSGGLVWLQTDVNNDAGAQIIRAACKGHSGAHATLFRTPQSDVPGTPKTTVPVFHPLEPAHMALTKSIKQSIDPRGIFNPCAMYAGL